jgi:hypothetical protein
VVGVSGIGGDALVGAGNDDPYATGLLWIMGTGAPEPCDDLDLMFRTFMPVPPSSCPADTDGSANGGDASGPEPGSPPDGIVDVNDLTAVISAWGACP